MVREKRANSILSANIDYDMGLRSESTEGLEGFFNAYKRAEKAMVEEEFREIDTIARDVLLIRTFILLSINFGENEEIVSSVDINSLRAGESAEDVLKRMEDRINYIEMELNTRKLLSVALASSDDRVALDDSWKVKAGTYIAHIRTAVVNAEMNETLRERIFSKLNELQAEIDRNRTRVETISEVFLAITEAVGKGAKHLDGAVKLVERLAGALSGAKTAALEHKSVLKLPPPESVGLSDLE